MPQIPRAQRRVSRSGINVGRVIDTKTNDSFGNGQAAQQAEKSRLGRDKAVAGAINEVDQFKREYDKTEGMRASNSFDIERQSIQNEYLAERGKNAATNWSKYQEKINEAKEKHMEDLSNDGQIETYNSYAGKSERAFINKSRAHQMQESRVYNKEVRKEKMQLIQDDAISSYSEPGKVPESIAAMDEIVDSEAMLDGHSAEWVANRKLENRTKVNASIVGKLVGEDQAVKAKHWLEQNENNFDPETYVKMKEVVDKAYTKEKHQGIVDNMVGEGIKEKDGLAAIRKRYKGEEQDQLVGRYKRRMNEVEKKKKATKNEKILSIVDQIKAGVHLDDIPEVTSSGFNKIDSKFLLRTYEKHQTGGDVKTDLRVKSQVREMLLNPETRDKAIRDGVLENSADSLSTDDYIEMKRFELFAANNDLDKLDSWQSKKQKFTGLSTNAGLELNKEENKALQEKYYSELEKHQQNTGKSVTPEDEKEIFNSLTMEVITDKDNAEWLQFGDKKKKVFELKGDDFAIEDVDNGLVSYIERELILKGQLAENAPLDERDDAVKKALSKDFLRYEQVKEQLNSKNIAKGNN